MDDAATSTQSTSASAPTGRVAAIANLRLVFGNRDLRRVQLAFFGSVIGDWAYSTAIMVYAYQAGGATLLGAWSGIRLLLTAVAAPLGGVVADRMSRRTFMLFNDGIRAILVVAVAACLHVGAPVAAILALAALVPIIGGSFRPAQSGLMPQLAHSPNELTASNAAAGMLENTAIFVGPALGGLLIGVLGVEWVVVLNGLTFLVSLLLVLGVRRVARAPESGAGGSSFFGEAAGGFRVLGKDRDMAAFTGLMALNGLLNGALNVLLVLVAVKAFGAASGVGYFNSILGAGAIIGGGVLLGRLANIRLGRTMVIGLLGWCVPIILIGVVPNVVVVCVALFVVGVADPLINLGFGTIPQRIVDERAMSRVYGALEAAFIASMALGAFLVPVLIHTTSLAITTVVFGGASTVLALVCGMRMPHLDSRMSEPAGLALIRSISLFGPLGPVVQEQLARKLQPVPAAPGQVLIAEGMASDRFYCVETGEVEVTQGGRVLRHQGPGEFFGEIGLLRDVPRTATVTAVGEVTLQSLSREDFLEAVAGDQTVRGLANDIVTRRLAA